MAPGVICLPQRGHPQGHDVEPVEKVCSKSARVDFRFERLVRCGDNSHVDVHDRPCAHPLDLTFLQDAQELRLHLRRHVAHLVEKQSPPICSLELAAPLLGGSGKRARFMPEELTFDQAFGHRRTVELFERLAGPRGATVNRRGDQLFARAPLT